MLVRMRQKPDHDCNSGIVRCAGSSQSTPPATDGQKAMKANAKRASAPSQTGRRNGDVGAGEAIARDVAGRPRENQSGRPSLRNGLRDRTSTTLALRFAVCDTRVARLWPRPNAERALIPDIS